MDLLFLNNYVVATDAKKKIAETRLPPAPRGRLRHGDGELSGAGGFLASLGPMEKTFLGLWIVMGALYWLNYRKTENLLLAYLKVGALFGFVYGTMKGMDWLSHDVPANERIVFFQAQPTESGHRVPQLAYAFEVFAGVIVLMICWYARKKVTTVCSLVLSSWDRGHWYVLPVLFVLVTIGLVLVAAAASPVLSPFIYTLF